MADGLVISAAWLDGVKQSLDQVRSAGQAAAAVQSAVDFAGNVNGELDPGVLNWLFSSDVFGDPWRAAAQKQITDAMREVQALDVYYGGDSALPVGASWPVHRVKILNLYSLAQVIYKGYPQDVDSGGMAAQLFAGSTDLTSAILSAPKAVVNYAVDLGKTAVRGAAGIVKEAASGVSEAVSSLVPWPVVIGAVLVGTGLVFGLVYMAKSGVKVPLT